MHKLSLLVGAVSLLALSGCGSDSDDLPPPPTPPAPPPPPVTIVDVAVDNGSFTTLVAALTEAQLVDALSDPDASFTVFAPTDDAFALLGQDAIDDLLANQDQLTDVLTYHVIDGEVNAEAAIAAAGATVEMFNGDSVGLSFVNDTLFVNQATVTSTDIQTDNGIIHVIDAVLMPPAERGEPTANIVETAVAAGSFETLVAAVEAAGLADTLSDPNAEFTVFAPTDDAFAMLGQDTIDVLLDNPDVLEGILLQHVVPGTVNSITAFSLVGQSPETASGATIPVGLNADTDLLTFGGANIVTTDIYTTNGVIHVIDMVVVADVEVPAPPVSIVDVAVENGSFTTLVAALQATGLDTVLANTDEQFTVFAPTDAAFALLGQDAIDDLLMDTAALSNILQYHVISGATILQDAAVTVAQSNDSLVTMTNMQDAALSLSGSDLYVNASRVALADVMADNGVIHVVDQVILPPADRGEPTQNIAEVVVSNANFSTLLAALDIAGLDTTLADEMETFTVFAPTNAAFDKIEDMALDGLLADTDALTNVLLQHVIIGAEVNSLGAYAANGSNVDTAAMEDVSVAIVNFAQAENTDSTEVSYDAVNQRLVGGLGSDNPGFTLYTFDNDLGTGGSACVDGCATNWPPVIVTDGDVSSIPGLSVIERGDGSMQAAYQGRPLYFFANDTAAGDTNGQGVGDVWYTVDQPQVALQIQGSNVTTTDIYTTNGVIHVIDTVITETLE
ncbi:fasciclin domain-containing protein [Alteromonas sp. ASW11-36]|uniref:Fasciclin domain-containing protein n=1 Tax=Alteromonas arenosi TaxID=3055817 RepID=A0ABT7SX39_9ALTE|nr:fasciclin domain-containing protein [Alteromonas sp. ASW11-36]MDM7860758.1 fasciclin domain-containing protein [Alteromonas sp. ASW11-36]